MGEANVKRACTVAFVWMAIASNAAAISLSLYLFRYSIFCGLGVGSYSFILYVLSLLLIGASMIFSKTATAVPMLKVLFIVNAAYILLVLAQGLCFSCVDACVETSQ